jgi:hypothetical protein
MSTLIVKDWTPEWAESSAAPDLPVRDAGGSSEEPGGTPRRRGFGGSQPRQRINYPGLSTGVRSFPARPPPGAARADLESAAALLSLGRAGKPVRPKSAAAALDRARPGPRPLSRYMGVTRHVKGM